VIAVDRFGNDDQDDTISTGSPIPPVPPPPRGGWNWRSPRAATFAGVAVIALAAGAGAGYSATRSSPSPASEASAAAANPSSTPTPSAGVPGKNRHGWIRFGGPFGFGPAGIGGGVLHGQFTVPKQGGGYETLDVQQGAATAVSGTSISVKSSDGYTATYTVTSSTVVDARASGISSVKKGDTVMVIATAGSTPTAASIADISAIKAGRASLHLPAQSGKPFFTRPAAAPPAGT
jgi:hypothetical protein